MGAKVKLICKRCKQPRMVHLNMSKASLRRGWKQELCQACNLLIKRVKAFKRDKLRASCPFFNRSAKRPPM
jgi:hypothetical protein